MQQVVEVLVLAELVEVQVLGVLALAAEVEVQELEVFALAAFVELLEGMALAALAEGQLEPLTLAAYPEVP